MSQHPMVCVNAFSPLAIVILPLSAKLTIAISKKKAAGLHWCCFPSVLFVSGGTSVRYDPVRWLLVLVAAQLLTIVPFDSCFFPRSGVHQVDVRWEEWHTSLALQVLGEDSVQGGAWDGHTVDVSYSPNPALLGQPLTLTVTPRDDAGAAVTEALPHTLCTLQPSGADVTDGPHLHHGTWRATLVPRCAAPTVTVTVGGTTTTPTLFVCGGHS